MKRLLVLLSVFALGVDLVACGKSDKQIATSTAAARASLATASANSSVHHNDRDNDGDHNDDDNEVLQYGHRAGPTDRVTSVALVTHYLAAAAAENGTMACTLLAPAIAESVAETNGRSPGLRGTTCAVVMSKLFKLHHKLLAEKHATLKVLDVRVEGTRALVILEFPAIPEVRQITERRLGGRWRIVDLLDGILE